MKLSHKSLLLIYNFHGYEHGHELCFSCFCSLASYAKLSISQANGGVEIKRNSAVFLLIEITLLTIVSTKNTIKHKMYRNIRQNMIN